MYNWFSIISTPIISAFIGWVTTYLAIKMIFRPRRAIKIGFFSLQGLIPRRQVELAKSIGEVVERELISHRDIQEVLASDEIQTELAEGIEKQVDAFVREKLLSNPMIGMFLQGEMLQGIKGSLNQQLKQGLPEMLDILISKIETNVNFQMIVSQKVAEFDLFKLEEIIYTIAAKELRGIEYLCGVLGFIIGIGQVCLTIFTT